MLAAVTVLDFWWVPPAVLGACLICRVWWLLPLAVAATALAAVVRLSSFH